MLDASQFMHTYIYIYGEKLHSRTMTFTFITNLTLGYGKIQCDTLTFKKIYAKIPSPPEKQKCP